MCGIAGILTREPGAIDLQPALGAMQAALRHRGPDDAGLWQAPSGCAGLAHTRLAILDLSPAGHQPMSTLDGRFTIVFNGEIYNFLELRRALEQKGEQFHDPDRHRSDSPRLSGPRCVVHRAACAACSRSRFGTSRSGPACSRATDSASSRSTTILPAAGSCSRPRLRALLASRLVPRDMDAQAAFGYFRTGSVPEPRTLLKQVRCLEAGHFARWRGRPA